MASTLLLGFCVVCNLFNTAIQATNSDHIEDLFTIPIANILNNPSAIKSYSNQLKNAGIFRIENILTNNAVTYLAEQLKKSPMAPSDAWTNAWQANTINNDYPIDHPINYMTRSKNQYVGRSVLPQIIIDIYEYKPMLQLFSKILSVQHGYESLHLSSDLHGSVYGRIGKDGDGGAWHFDQHPFSCVWMLQKPLNEGGGQLRYVYMPPVKHERENGTVFEWDWNLMSKIYAKDEDTWTLHVKQLRDVNVGDVYCFEGNITFHDITPVVGDVDRMVFVTAFAEIANFEHSNIVKQNNKWNKYDIDLQHVDEIHSAHVEL